MSMFLDLDAEQRRNAIAATADKLSLAPVSVEKDYMVCSALRVLYSMLNSRAQVTFKGGTSLSKAYGLIKRFSEDVDLVVDRELIGADPEPSGLRSLSIRARAMYVKRIQRCLEQWIEEVAQPHFSDPPKLSDGEPLWSCRVDDGTPYRDTLLLEYNSVLEGPASDYIRPSVRLEFGARADTWPTQTREVQSYVVEQFSESIQESRVIVEALCPERTFLEKLCLVYEEVARSADSTPRPAQARHFYDLYCLINSGVGDQALSDRALFERVVEHREMYFIRKGIDYDKMRTRSMTVVPLGSQLKLWRQDYDQLKENMLFGISPDFDDVIACIDRFASYALS